MTTATKTSRIVLDLADLTNGMYAIVQDAGVLFIKDGDSISFCFTTDKEEQTDREIQETLAWNLPGDATISSQASEISVDYTDWTVSL